VQTFKGIDIGAIGYADPDKVIFYREPERRHTSGSEFAVMTTRHCPPSKWLRYCEAPGLFIDAAVEHGAKGIIVDGVGAGVATTSQTEAIKRAQAKGVVVVMTARVPQRTPVQDTPRRREANIIPGDNLLPEKARLLLQFALTETTDYKRSSGSSTVLSASAYEKARLKKSTTIAMQLHARTFVLRGVFFTALVCASLTLPRSTSKNATIADLEKAFAQGGLTAEKLTSLYLARIDGLRPKRSGDQHRHHAQPQGAR